MNRGYRLWGVVLEVWSLFIVLWREKCLWCYIHIGMFLGFHLFVPLSSHWSISCTLTCIIMLKVCLLVVKTKPSAAVQTSGLASRIKIRKHHKTSSCVNLCQCVCMCVCDTLHVFTQPLICHSPYLTHVCVKVVAPHSPSPCTSMTTHVGIWLRLVWHCLVFYCLNSAWNKGITKGLQSPELQRVSVCHLSLHRTSVILTAH